MQSTLKKHWLLHWTTGLIGTPRRYKYTLPIDNIHYLLDSQLGNTRSSQDALFTFFTECSFMMTFNTVRKGCVTVDCKKTINKYDSHVTCALHSECFDDGTFTPTDCIQCQHLWASVPFSDNSVITWKDRLNLMIRFTKSKFNRTLIYPKGFRITNL